MIKALYLQLLKIRPARLVLRRWRAKIQLLSGYSDPFFDLASIASVSNSALFIDVGCHKGEALLRFIESGIKCPVAAFDPFIESIESARRNLNSYPNITYHPMAVSDVDGTARFYQNKNEQTSSLLANDLGNAESFPEDTSTISEITVPTIRLDTWATTNPVDTFAVVKCDTQGAEGKVVRGGIEFIRDKVAAFYCEVMLGNMYQGQTSLTQLRDMLENECGMVLRNVYPCLHDRQGRAVQFDALWVKPQYLPNTFLDNS
jgi:FkbM family methyltransferase